MVQQRALVLGLMVGAGTLAQDMGKSVDCTVSYTEAYMSTLNGECSLSGCTPNCQAKINAARNSCAHQKYNETDPITGIIAERSFMQKSIQALELMGPVDCDYRVEVEHRTEEILAYHQGHVADELREADHQTELAPIHRALQGLPPGSAPVDDPACTMSYQQAFDATLSGDCSHHTCTAACQIIITNMLAACKGQFFTYNERTGTPVTSMFNSRAVVALRLLGPADCAYHTGYQECGDQCNIVNATRGLNGLAHGESTSDPECAVFYMGVDFHEWTGCGTPSFSPGGPWNTVSQAVKDRCWARFVSYVESCAGCTDPYIQQFLKKAATATANTHCEDCDQPQQIADKIRQLCCAGADGILGNPDDPCTPHVETNTDSATTWYMPETCEEDSACQAYIVQLANHSCPSLFISNGDCLGMYHECGGDVEDLLSHHGSSGMSPSAEPYDPSMGMGPSAEPFDPSMGMSPSAEPWCEQYLDECAPERPTRGFVLPEQQTCPTQFFREKIKLSLARSL